MKRLPEAIFSKIIGIILLGASSAKPVLKPLKFPATKTSVDTPTSTISKVDSFAILRKMIPQLDTNSLVIFDAGSVLITKTDPGERGYKKERKKARTRNTLHNKGSALYNQLDAVTRTRLSAIYKKGAQRQLIDKTIPDLIGQLQKKGVKVIVLTRFITGKVNNVEAIEKVRLNNLRSLGIDVRAAFPEHPYITFDQFLFEKRSPIFRDGILFTTRATAKGDLLAAFLEKVQWKPNKVIMFDNKTNNLQSVAGALKKMAIPFQGYKYTGVAKLPGFFDKALAEFQMQYLIDHEQWLPSDQARKVMNKQKNKKLFRH